MTAASAAPLSADVSVVPESSIQNVRGERRVSIRARGDSYGYAPRGPYIEISSAGAMKNVAVSASALPA
jgi:hypothetical protein